jgi:hypothetical protein
VSVDDDKGEAFLARWSRRKLERPAAGPASAADEPASVAPALPPVEKLTAEADFSGFMHPKVEDALRRVALKKLFADPHFNVADPFEAYSGDWTGGEPIPEAMLASLEQMKQLLRKPEQAGEAQAAEPQEVAKEEGPRPDEPGRQDT